MHLIITLTVCILVSFLFYELAKKLNISTTIGLIVAGILIGSSSLKDIILGPNTGFVLGLGDFALIVLMFIAGMEISWSEFCREEKEASIISVFAAIVPFLAGFLIFLMIGFSFPTAMAVGICMSITAEATKAKELLELKKMKTRVGSLLMGAGIIDDISGMFLFVALCYWFNGLLIMKAPLLFAGVILAFFVGIGVHKVIGRHTHKVHILEKTMMRFVVPFFFISMGFHFSFHSLTLNISLIVMILMIATLGKIIGVFLTKPLLNLSWKQLYLIGWGMNSRGAVELSIAFIAYMIGLIDNIIYSGLVIMTLVTTLIFPFVIRKMIKNNPRIMN
ncbi:MAG: cation:proton antiporter [Candidatus Aenigmarchaeota archaeon]|nr:cation:proton antiporter [Candidatus Aenigmarchaeota archaeon]